MKITWVLANTVVLDPMLDTVTLKNIGPCWGSWRTWRAAQTDNVICHDQTRAKELLDKEFHRQCNLFLHQSTHESLLKPGGTQVYGGDFVEPTEREEEIIAMHLASSQSDIVLLLGFDFGPQPAYADPALQRRAENYRLYVQHIIKDNDQVQWVLVDHDAKLMPEVENLPNLTVDSLANIIKMLNT